VADKTRDEGGKTLFNKIYMIKKFLSDVFFSVLMHIKYYKYLSGFNVIIRKSSVLGQKILIDAKVHLYNSIIHDNINIYNVFVVEGGEKVMEP